ncbi:hypothetical protein CLU85_0274 [Acidovorax sp. 69]|uniref:hypothetical protein n=1 Tax=Acidovorax sp. 69 TaxID=2035202 RepID=UPI000CB85C2B|nr:hypothetical protein [Acidovorax sp. 69]PJI95563.1 hypothetical protein CLU85_0274 [Acidovorax sp. 69]
MSTHTIFRAYRYQLLPLDRNETKDLYLNFSVEEIVARKNDFFAEALTHLPKISHKRVEVNISIEEVQQDFFRVKLAPSRPLTRETADSRREKIENWPHIEAYILNNPDDQLLIIQERVSAFANTDTVANIILRGTRVALDQIGLSLQIESMFNESYFWGLVNQYSNRITWVEFEFITPNMANISKTLANTLKNLGKQTNAVKEQLTLRSDPSSSLDIDQSNETIQGLVEYTSKGAGDIKLKIKGIRKRFQTSTSRREVHLSGIEITADANEIVEIIRAALK